MGKGSFTDKDGKIVDVVDFDATSSKDGKALHYVQGDINGKMNPNGKRQANNVVYVAKSAGQPLMWPTATPATLASGDPP